VLENAVVDLMKPAFCRYVSSWQEAHICIPRSLLSNSKIIFERNPQHKCCILLILVY
jgi:hypothetical protein